MRYLFIFFLFITSLIRSQEIAVLSTVYADDFRDWIFYDTKDREIGTLRTRWQLNRDYSQWDVRVGELSGSILLRWQDRPNEWEMRIQNAFYTIQPTWPGQFDSWRIKDNDNKTYYLNLIRDPEGFQWALEQDQNAICYIYNVYYEDPREWQIERVNKNDSIDTPLIIAALFTATYYSTPK